MKKEAQLDSWLMDIHHGEPKMMMYDDFLKGHGITLGIRMGFWALKAFSVVTWSARDFMENIIIRFGWKLEGISWDLNAF